MPDCANPGALHTPGSMKCALSEQNRDLIRVEMDIKGCQRSDNLVADRRAGGAGVGERLGPAELPNVRELEALEADFQTGKVRSRCSLHKRLFSFMEKYEQTYLLEGEFSQRVAQGLPESRAHYLIDPWNSPYWIRDRCRGDRRVTFIYSFGPDRKRDSSEWEVLGDDIGIYIRPDAD